MADKRNIPTIASRKPEEPATPNELQKIRQSLSSRFKQAAELLTAIARPLPLQTGDDTYVKEPPREDYFANLKSLKLEDYGTVVRMIKTQVTGEPWDDRQYLMEDAIKLTSHLPVNSKASKQITDALITQLWDNLEHPPMSYMGINQWTAPQKLPDVRYRTADGSYNNLANPSLGAAFTPYARSCIPKVITRAALPDAGVVFDSLMKRTVNQKHETKVSSMLFYVASIIIHDLFRTSHKDFGTSQTSSYLDLSPLYGSNQEEQNQMRTFHDGKIKPDCFAEARILAFPPGVSTLLIMFNRFHNHVVETLAGINENGRFDTPEQAAQKGNKNKTNTARDEDLFQVGRLIVCGLYCNIILMDYVRVILNMHRSNSTWMIDPRNPIKGGPPLGTGNAVSAEFNLVYRWHSTLSERDTKFTEDLYKELFGGEDYEKMGMPEFLAGLAKFEQAIPKDPYERPIKNQSHENLKRGSNGKFNDDDLVKILTESTLDGANSFGANRVPAVMRAVEILGIEQGRAWNLATLNEFRKFFGLKTYQTFEEINPDPHVASTLRNLYDQPDLVELYTGLVVEDAKISIAPGSGLCPPFTTSRAILADAVALIRGDRFHTTDFNPKALTNWGYAAVQSDPTVDQGACFYKLFYNAFPNHYERNSAYAHFPLVIPSETENILDRLGRKGDYSFALPKQKPAQHIITSYKACTDISSNQSDFKVTWGDAMTYLMGEPAKDFMLSGDGPKNAESRFIVKPALYPSSADWKQSVKDFYEQKTRELLDEKAYKLGGVNEVDIIRDVSNMVNVHFAAHMFALPIKDRAHPRGVFTEKEIYLIMAAVFTCVFFDLDPEHSNQVRHLAYGATQKLGALVEKNVQAVHDSGVFSKIIQYVLNRNETTVLQHYGIHMIQRLLSSGVPVKQLVWGHILGTAGGMVPNQGQLFAQMLEYYFEEGKEHWPEIARLAKQDTPEADDILMHYFLEGSRINCGSAIFRQAQKDSVVKDGKQEVKIKKGDTVFVNFREASLDPTMFPDPHKVKLDRPLDSYLQFGWGPHQCLGLPMSRMALTHMLKVIARLKNLRPVEGPRGKIAKTESEVPGYYKYLTEGWEGFFPFPTSLKVTWDD